MSKCVDVFSHPNVFEIVETFKKEQASTEVSLVQLAADAAPPWHRSRVIRRDWMIAELKQWGAYVLLRLKYSFQEWSMHFKYFISGGPNISKYKDWEKPIWGGTQA